MSDGLGVSVDFNVIKNKSLVPCGVETGLYDLCCLADMQEWHMHIGICEKQKITQKIFTIKTHV